MFSTYVDELKLVGPSRFAARVTCPMFLVRALDVGEEGDDEPAFDTKVTLREDVVRAAAERPSDRPPGARLGPGQVLRIEKRQDGAFPDRIGIGRAPNVDVRLPVAQVSKYHAYIARDGETWTLTDAGSSNGTFVHGTALDARVPVALVDAVEVGFGGCRMRFYTPEGFVRFVQSRTR